MGWAAGRRADADGLDAAPPAAPPPVDLYVAYASRATRRAAFRLAADARRAGHARKTRTRRAAASRASSSRPIARGARYVAIFGDEGTALKDMETGEQQATSHPSTVMHHIRRAL